MIIRWLLGISGVNKGIDLQASPTPAHETIPGVTFGTPKPPSTRCLEVAIPHGLTVSDLVADVNTATRFCREIIAAIDYEGGGRFDGLALRKAGPRLPADTVKKLGMRANTILSETFYGLLTLEARKNPLQSASVIAVTINSALASCRDLGNMKAALGRRGQVRLLPSQMLAGPCEAAVVRNASRMRVDQATMLPLLECDRPGQCACVYRAEFDLS